MLVGYSVSHYIKVHETSSVIVNIYTTCKILAWSEWGNRVKQRLVILSLAFLLLGRAFSVEEDGLVIRPRQERPVAPPDLQVLAKKLNGADFHEVRKVALDLADSHDAKALPLLLNFSIEGDAQRRMLGVRCIGKLNLPGAEDTLFKLALGDLYVSLRLAAAEELARLESCDKTAARFIDVLNDEKSPLKGFRYRALQALAHIGGKGAVDCLTQFLNHPQSDIAVAAAEGLGMQHDLSVATPLIAVLGSPDPELKAAAAEALERLTGEAFRFDVVKWAQWQKDQAAAKEKPGKTRVAPARLPENVLEEGYEPPAKNPDADAVDIMIVFDTTGSMLHIWPQVSTALDAVLQNLVKTTPSLRMGTIKYRAADPEHTQTYMIKAKPLTRKFDEIRDDVLDATFGGGSGGLQLGLDYAVRVMPWRVKSRKIIILVGDTSPTDESTRSCMRTIAEAWQMDGILVDTLYVHTMHGAEHFDTYRLLAAYGKGRFYEFNKAERHLVEMSAEKIDVKVAETPEETAKKLCTPRK